MTNRTIERREPAVGARAVYHGQWPWHDYYCRVIGIDPAWTDGGFSSPRPAWIVEWEFDALDDRAATVNRIPQYLSVEKFHAVPEVK